MSDRPIHVPPRLPGPRMVAVARKGNVVTVEMLCTDEYAAMALFDRLCGEADKDVQMSSRKRP